MVKKRLKRCVVHSLRLSGAGGRRGRWPGGFAWDWAPSNAGWHGQVKTGWPAPTGVTGRTGRIGRDRRHDGLRCASWSCVTS